MQTGRWGRFDEPVVALDHGVLWYRGLRYEVDGLATIPLLVDGRTACYVESYKIGVALRVRGRVPWRWRHAVHGRVLSGRWDSTGGILTLVEVTAVDASGFPVLGSLQLRGER